MQQDAEECWSQILYVLKEKLKDAPAAATGSPATVDDLFGLGLATTLKCEESGEEASESSTSYMLKCNIAGDTNHLHQGISLGLREDREKNSAQLGRLALFKGASVITKLPEFLTVRALRCCGAVVGVRLLLLVVLPASAAPVARLWNACTNACCTIGMPYI